MNGIGYTMRKLLLILGCVLCALPAMPQGFNWQWAKCSTGPGYQEGNFVAADASDNVYMTGYFHGASITFGNTTLLNGGYGNCFLVKYSAAGDFIWAKGATLPAQGSPNNDIEGNIIATDGFGNIYEVGGYSGNLMRLDGTLLPFNHSNTDFYLVKYDSSGNVLWVRTGSGGGNDWGEGVATDSAGNVFITGAYNGLSMMIGSTYLFNSGTQNTSDFFIAKFDTGGTLQWAKTADGPSNDASAECIAADKQGNAYITGTFTNDSISFDTIKLRTAYTGATNFFIARYNPLGKVLWARAFGGAFEDHGNGITPDGNGNIYLTGSFSSDSITFGPYTLYNKTTGGAYQDFFIAKLDTLGYVLWARATGGVGDAMGYTVAAGNSRVYISGSFLSPSISFDSTTLTAPAVSSGPMFVVSYDSAGTVFCAAALASGNGRTDQNGVCCSNRGDVYIASTYYGVNPFVVGTDTLALTGADDAFIAKFNCRLETDIENVTEDVMLEIYPNPFQSNIALKYALPVNATTAEVMVFDISGRQLTSYPLKYAAGAVQINPGKLSNGIYFFALVVDGKTTVTKKVIKVD